VWPLEIVIQGASQISFKQEATEQAGLESSLLVRAAVMPPFLFPMPLEPRINANKHEFEKSKKPGAGCPILRVLCEGWDLYGTRFPLEEFAEKYHLDFGEPITRKLLHEGPRR
jgi:hypothetical protein